MPHAPPHVWYRSIQSIFSTAVVHLFSEHVSRVSHGPALVQTLSLDRRSRQLEPSVLSCALRWCLPGLRFLGDTFTALCPVLYQRLAQSRASVCGMNDLLVAFPLRV